MLEADANDSARQRMHPTRQAILEQIKRRGRATIHDLARDVGVSPVTVRHHLYALSADDLVEKTTIRHGVGRPQHSYSLTQVGERHFPNRYHVLATHLLSTVKRLKPKAVVLQLLENTARQLSHFPPPLNDLSPEQRLAALQRHFQDQDIPIHIERMPDGSAQAVLGCPYYHVGQHHPEICHIDETLLGEALQVPIEHTSCLLQGDKSCTFSIQLGDSVAAR